MAERLRAAVWGGLAALACRAAPAPEPRGPVPASSQPTPATTLSTPAPAAEPLVAAPAPARWVLLPKSSHWAPAFQRTTDAGMLYAGPGNERWLVSEGVAARGAGPDAVTLAGALPNPTGHSFITPGGDVYEASSALGDLSLAVAASKTYIDAAAGRDHFLAIEESGRLQRSGDRGRTWQAATVLQGVERFTDVVMLESGAGLLLADHAGKSALFSTRDDGASWNEIDSQAYTFTGLTSYREQLQPIVRVNRQHDFYMHVSLDPALTRVIGEGRVSRSYTPFPYPAALPPDLATFVSARAAAPGVRKTPLLWLALRETSWEPSVWELSVVPFGELPSYRVVKELADCALSVAATPSVIALACRRPSPRKDALFLSEDAGQSFRRLPLPPNPVALHAVGDSLVVQTPCDGPAESRGAFLLAPPTWRAVPVSDTTCRRHLAFTGAAEPRELFSVAWADGELTLHRWTASGREPSLLSVVSPAPHLPIQRVTLSRERSTVVVALPTAHPWPPVTEATETASPPKPVLFRSLDGGRHFSEVALPTAFRALALSGRRGLGIDHEDGGWATHDLGTTWARVAAPIDVGRTPVECSEAGCITVRGLRVGWER